ncbi:ArsR/SmtB family transcription factor [Halobellus rubicundus]|uniref:ArsR/SmtB family transcription factor n=1 Tax=Halobellus rubicundus TaxID=2996466 RepID=A0ABD5MEX7_9EURY
MADILPSRPDLPDDEDKDPRVVGLDSDDVDDLLAAISSETARQLLGELHEEPGPPSDLADRADTSIQNAQYHLDRLETAGLIEPAGTAYSAKGREMTVYAPSDQALVVVAGSEDDTTGLQSALTQLLGGLGVVALGSVVVDRLVRAGAGPTLSTGAGSAGGDGGAGGSADGGATAADAGGGGANLTGGTTAEPTATPTAEPATPTATESDMQIAEATGSPTQTPTQTPLPEPTETVAEATRTATEAAQTAAATTQSAAGGDPIGALGSAVASLPPGAFFFLGGVVALAFVAIAWQR